MMISTFKVYDSDYVRKRRNKKTNRIFLSLMTKSNKSLKIVRNKFFFVFSEF